MCYCGRNPNVLRCQNCPPGERGERGRSIAWRQTAEGAGANCTYGGFKIEVGFDDDYDGIPETNVQTTYLCNAAPGADGATPTLIAGTITALAATDPPTFTLTATGNPNEYAINLGIPVGADGVIPTIAIGTVTTLAAGDLATVTIDGASTPTNVILNFGIPAGATGATGPAGASGSATQGLPGEFLAMITADTQQTVLLDDVIVNTYTSQGKIAFPNDVSNGGFDNGNNWLLHNYTVPGGSFAAATFRANNIALELLENNLGAGDQRILKCCITKNGTILVNTTEEFTIDNISTVNTLYYFSDFNTGSIAMTATDIFAIEFYEKNPGGDVTTIRVRIINGFVSLEL